MIPSLILLSTNSDDREFFEDVTEQAGVGFEALDRDGTERLRTIMSTNSSAVVVADMDRSGFYEPLLDVFAKYAPSRRAFMVCSKQGSGYFSHLAQNRFGHYLLRKYSDPAASVYAGMVKMAMKNDFSGVQPFFLDEVKVRKLTISRVSHKNAAIEGIRSVINKLGIKHRLATLVSQATDELVLNAMFDAPTEPDGFRSIHHRPRHLEVELKESERVEINLAANSEFMALTVRDQFGALDADTLKNTLLQRSHSESEGTGLHGIYVSGLSMMYVREPGIRTDITLVFPRIESYKEFRNGFQFLSVITLKKT